MEYEIQLIEEKTHDWIAGYILPIEPQVGDYVPSQSAAKDFYIIKKRMLPYGNTNKIICLVEKIDVDKFWHR